MSLLYKPKRLDIGAYIVQCGKGRHKNEEWWQLRLGRITHYRSSGGYRCAVLAEIFYTKDSYGGTDFDLRSGWANVSLANILGQVRGEVGSSAYEYRRLLRRVVKKYRDAIEAVGVL